MLYVEKRVDCIWGDYSQVQATLNCIELILERNMEGYTVFLSSQDYPVKNSDFIRKYLEEYNSYNHISIDWVEQVWPDYKLRTENYKFNYSSQRGDFRLFPSLAGKVRAKKLRLQLRLLYAWSKGRVNIADWRKIYAARESPLLPLYGGSNWWALNYYSLCRIYQYVLELPDYVAYHKYTLCVDEIFFHTLLKHIAITDPNIRFRDTVTYVNWHRKNCPLPVTFTEYDFGELSTLPDDKLFARKFATRQSSKVLDLIDEYILFTGSRQP